MGIRFKFKANRPRIIGSTDIKPYWKVIEDIVNVSDILLEILDARMPELSRNSEIEDLVKRKGKKLVLILNKMDLISKDSLKAIEDRLKEDNVVISISPRSRYGVKSLRDYILMEGKKNDGIKIGVLGYPNTGKSSIINALVRRKKAPTSSRAGTTRGQQWVKLKENILILDSPGVLPIKGNDELRYSLIGSRNPEKIKNLDLVAHHIIRLFSDKSVLEKVYNIKIENDDTDDIIEIIGRRKGFIKKGNEVDLTRTSMQVIRDWQNGILRL